MNNIGKTIKYKANPNAQTQIGIITDESLNGDICISGVWYSKSCIIILEIASNLAENNQQLLCE